MHCVLMWLSGTRPSKRQMGLHSLCRLGSCIYGHNEKLFRFLVGAAAQWPGTVQSPEVSYTYSGPQGVLDDAF